MVKSLSNLAAWLLGYRGIPYMSRPTFRWELASELCTGLAAGAMIPEFTQVFARKGLQGSAWIVGLLAAEITIGNFFGTIWASFLQRRRRVPYVVAAKLGIAAILLTIALLPASPAVAATYAVLLLWPALLSAVILNVTSSVWHNNYPTELRGQIFSRLVIIKMGAIILSTKLAGYALDTWTGWAHHVVYPAAALAMIGAAWCYSHVRVRLERTMLAGSAHRRFHPFEGFRLLRRDPAYGRFMLWQMLSGSMAMMAGPAIVLYLTDVWKVTYDSGTTLLVLVPLGLNILSMPFFGRLFDAIPVTRFRAIGADIHAAGKGIILAGLLARSWTVTVIGFAVEGLARATGGLAYNIAHTRFAPPGDSQVYMGIHMTLQGIRGLIMPFVSVWLYGYIGAYVLAIAAGAQFLSSVGFWLMKHEPETPLAAAVAVPRGRSAALPAQEPATNAPCPHEPAASGQ